MARPTKTAILILVNMVRRKTKAKPKRKARKRKGGAIQQLGNMRFEEATPMQRHEAVRDAWMNYQKTSEHPVEHSFMNQHEAMRDAWMNYKKTAGAGLSIPVKMPRRKLKKTGKRKRKGGGWSDFLSGAYTPRPKCNFSRSTPASHHMHRMAGAGLRKGGC